MLKVWIALIIIISIGSVVHADMMKLQGKWEAERRESFLGEESTTQDAIDLGSKSIVIHGDKYVSDKKKATIFVDPNKNPKIIDFLIESEEKTRILAVYELVRRYTKNMYR